MGEASPKHSRAPAGRNKSQDLTFIIFEEYRYFIEILIAEEESRK